MIHNTNHKNGDKLNASEWNNLAADVNQFSSANNKEYNSQNHSGLGKKALELKNGSNILIQEDFDQENTIYVIRYDFNLDGGTINVPNNCVLKFDGGSISNGTIVGTNTVIDADPIIIFNDVEIEGVWKKIEAYCEWFGAKGDGESDDTQAFYKTLNAFNSVMLLEKTYSVDWLNIQLSSKSIRGKNKFSSKIKQRNINTRFGLMRHNTIIENVTFEVKTYSTDDVFTPANTNRTDILLFGFEVGSVYRSFGNNTINHVIFNGDSNTVPIHFCLKYSGNGGTGIYNDITINTCLTGMWYEFAKLVFDKSHNDNDGWGFGWITEHTVSNVNINNPTEYGFRWDAISMYDQGKVNTEVTPNTITETMWCYANKFENIAVVLHRPNSTGFKVGHGMSRLVNPIVFNDCMSGVCYSVEFVPIGSPSQFKMFTTIEGGSLEGQVKNGDFVYTNIMKNVSASHRDNFRSTSQFFIQYNSDTIPQVVDLNIYGKNFYSMLKFFNAKFDECGKDNFGEYIKFSRISNDYQFGVRLDLPAEYLKSLHLQGGKYTIQVIGQSNRGNYTSGYRLNSGRYVYEIDGHTYEAKVWRDKIIANGFIELPNDPEEITDKISLFWGEAVSGEEVKMDWVKIYDIQFLNTIVGNYKVTLPAKHEKEFPSFANPSNIQNSNVNTGTSGEYITKYSKVFSSDGMPINDVSVPTRDVYSGLNTSEWENLVFGMQYSSRFNTALMVQGSMLSKVDTSSVQFKKAMSKDELAANLLGSKFNIRFESGQQVFITDEGEHGTPCAIYYDPEKVRMRFYLGVDSSHESWTAANSSDVVISQDDIIKLYFFGRIVSFNVTAGMTALEFTTAFKNKIKEEFASELVDDITVLPIPTDEHYLQQSKVGRMQVIDDENPDGIMIYVKYANQDNVYAYTGTLRVLHDDNNLMFKSFAGLESSTEDFTVVRGDGTVVEKFWT